MFFTGSKRKLARRPNVENLEPRQLLAAQPWNWAAVQIGQDQAAANYPQLTGAGEAVVIIDSGVDYKHPSLGGGIGPSFKVEAGHDFMSNDADPFPDTFAHGTGAAGVIAAEGYYVNGKFGQGIAPDVKLIALRQNNSAQVKQALEWVLANRVKYNIVAINLCDYGGGGSGPRQYQAVMKQLIAAGVFISHPSGNGGPSAGVGPALDPADFSVGSTNSANHVSSFTQRGAELDLLAPGEHVTLPYYDVNTKQHIYVDTADGTSWASPAVVGAAALIKQIDPRFTPAQVMKIMQDSGASVYDSVSKLTFKRLNVNAALALAYQRRGGTPEAPSPTGPVEVPTVQSPFSGTRVRIASGSVLQAEDFDAGGEGVAYHDTESVNHGNNSYRNGSAVDVETCVSGGRDVGFAKAGEWMEYSVDVAAAGTYTLAARIASLKAGGKFHVAIDGVDKTGQIAVLDTGGWQRWGTISKAGVALTAGQHVIRVQMDSVGKVGYTANFDSFTFTQTAGQPAAAATPAAHSALSTTNAVNFTAASGVIKDANGISHLDQGDWAQYRAFDFGTAGATTFTANLAAAPGAGGKRIQIRLGSPTGTVIGTLTVKATASWGTFAAQSTSVTRTTGVHDVYLTFDGGAAVANVKSFKFA